MERPPLSVTTRAGDIAAPAVGVTTPEARRAARCAACRLLSLQASFNYETLHGTGFAYALLPLLRYIYDRDDDALARAVARHAELFNAHPYLAPLAVGAVGRLEAEATDPMLIRRFKNALRSSLGALGDQLVWATWRPTCALAAVALLLLGVPWWIAVLAFLIAYNVLHLHLRVWGFHRGLRFGLEVARALRSPAWDRLRQQAAQVGAGLAGFCLVAAMAWTPAWWGAAPPVATPVFVAAAAVGTLWADRSRRLAIGLWIALAASGFLTGSKGG